jgi:hypothetical protein
MTIQNFDSLFAVNVRAPYFSSSSSCEPRLGSSPVFLTSAAARASVTKAGGGASGAFASDAVRDQL